MLPSTADDEDGGEVALQAQLLARLLLSGTVIEQRLPDRIARKDELVGRDMIIQGDFIRLFFLFLFQVLQAGQNFISGQVETQFFRYFDIGFRCLAVASGGAS